MFINEIPLTTELNILIKIKNNEITLVSSVVDLGESLYNIKEKIEERVKHKVLMIPALQSDGKYINFESDGIHTSLLVTIDNLEYEFKHVLISSMVIMGKKYTLLMSNEDITFINRRENFRVDIGVPCIIMINGHRKAVNGTVKDLSNNGVGIIVENELICKESDLVRLKFEDVRRKVQFTAECTIVRIGEINERKKLLGCLIENIRPNPNYYINMVQRDLLKHDRE